jgi:hypothetical protein
VNVLRFILSLPGCDPLATGPRGDTALIALCQGAAPGGLASNASGSAYRPEEAAAAATLLLDTAPALVATPDSKGRGPLHWAVASGRVELVATLVRAARRLEERDGAGEEDVALADRALSGADDAGFSPLQAAEAFQLIATAAEAHSKEQKQQGQAKTGRKLEAETLPSAAAAQSLAERLSTGRLAGPDPADRPAPAADGGDRAGASPVAPEAAQGRQAGHGGRWGEGRQGRSGGSARNRRGGGGGPGGVPGPKFDKDAVAYTEAYGIRGQGQSRGRARAGADAAAVEAAGGENDGARQGAWAVLLEVADGVGLYAALSGAGAMRRSITRRSLLAHFGLDCVLRVRRTFEGGAFEATALWITDTYISLTNYPTPHKQDARRLVLGEEEGPDAGEDKDDEGKTKGEQQGNPMAATNGGRRRLHRARGRLTPAGRRAAMGAAEHAANVCHEIVNMRRAAAQGGGGGQGQRRNDRRKGKRGDDGTEVETWWQAMWAPTGGKGAGPGGAGLSDAALSFVLERHLLDPATRPQTLGMWALIVAEAMDLALQAHGGDAAALVGAGGVFPSLAAASPLWATVLGALGKLGRCLCFGLVGQQEGPGGEILTQREEVLFENLLDVVLRLLVPLAAAMAADTGDDDGAALVRRLTEPYLGPVWRLMGDALDSVDGMVEEPMRFAGACAEGVRRLTMPLLRAQSIQVRFATNYRLIHPKSKTPPFSPDARVHGLDNGHLLRPAVGGCLPGARAGSGVRLHAQDDGGGGWDRQQVREG